MSKRVLKQFDRAAKLAHVVMLRDGFDDATAHAILTDSRARFETLIPRIPDPGKEGAHLKMFTIASAAEFAFWLEMKARGYTPQQTYRIVEPVSRGLLERIPAFLRRMIGATFYSRIMLDRVRHGAQVSQERPLGGWQYEFVEGNDEFDFGVNYTRCAHSKHSPSGCLDRTTGVALEQPCGPSHSPRWRLSAHTGARSPHLPPRNGLAGSRVATKCRYGTAVSGGWGTSSPTRELWVLRWSDTTTAVTRSGATLTSLCAARPPTPSATTNTGASSARQKRLIAPLMFSAATSTGPETSLP